MRLVIESEDDLAQLDLILDAVDLILSLVIQDPPFASRGLDGDSSADGLRAVVEFSSALTARARRLAAVRPN